MTKSNQHNGYSSFDNRIIFDDSCNHEDFEDFPIFESYTNQPKKSFIPWIALLFLSAAVSLSAFAIISSGSFRNTNLQQEKIEILQNSSDLNASKYASIEKLLDEVKIHSNINTNVYDIASNLTVENLTSVKFINAFNKYGVFSAPYSWLINNPTWQLVEPFKETTIKLMSSILSDDSIYVWKLQKSDSILIFEGHSINLIFNQTGNYSLSVFKFTKHLELIETLSTIIICKYVKRELRSLLPEDKQEFLEAMSNIWKYSNEEGKLKYGPNFTSIATFIEEHAIASGDILCDQFHDGTGFLTHHLAIQNAFELSLRTVNPAVTTHYWDFTIDGQIITNAKKTPSYLLEISPFFTDAWFGSVSEDHHIQDSLFKNMKMPKATTSSNIQNSYGYLRSYWNNNPDEFVQRCLFTVCGVEVINKKIPDCSHHYDILNTGSLGEFLLLSPSNGHGPIHVHTGGIWGECEENYKIFSKKWSYLLDANITDTDIYSYGYKPHTWLYGYTSIRKKFIELVFFGEYFHIYRSLWRSHTCAADQMPFALECPKYCNSSISSRDECRCHITSLMDGTKNYTNYMNCFFTTVKIRELVMKLFPIDMITDLMVLVSESAINEGDMIESASPADVIFWVIHLTIERLLAAKRMPAITTIGHQSFKKWQAEDESWLPYSYYNFKKGSNAYHPEKYTCTGHAEDDPALPVALHFTDSITNTADKNRDGIISNMEFYHALNPNDIDANDYVFDNFDWNHCKSNTHNDVILY